MKKLYILTLSLLAAVATQAQTITIFDKSGNEVPNNGVITINAYDEDQTEEDEDTPGYFYYVFDAGLSLQGSADGSITIKGEVQDQNVEGVSESSLIYQICPVECTSFANRQVTNVFNYTTSMGKKEMAIHLSTGYTVPLKDLVLYTQTQFSVFYTNNTASAKTFTLVFDYDSKNAGVNNITADTANAPVEYYNLQGVRVSNPTAGQLLIRRQANTVQKVIFK
jgi:hypothetical protein